MSHFLPQGVFRAWAWQSAGPGARQDLRSIGLDVDPAGVSADTLRNVVELDAQRADTKFQAGTENTVTRLRSTNNFNPLSGAFMEMNLLTSPQRPVAAEFFPSFSFLASQVCRRPPPVSIVYYVSM